jgi:hypothetical protein
MVQTKNNSKIGISFYKSADTVLSVLYCKFGFTFYNEKSISYPCNIPLLMHYVYAQTNKGRKPCQAIFRQHLFSQES